MIFKIERVASGYGNTCVVGKRNKGYYKFDIRNLKNFKLYGF